MLIELRIRNFAVIEDLSVELGPGLNALTGETGAGKSIIVGALSLLLGERATSDVVRAGADRAVVEAVFDLSGRPDLLEELGDLGFGAEDELLLLRREVQVEGRNRAWINGSPATASGLGGFGRSLVDLHGQHEHQTLLRSAEQRRILDAFGGSTDQARVVASLFGELKALRERLASEEAGRREMLARVDFLRFQQEEIAAANVEPDEDLRVEEELKRLDHAEELARDSEAVHDLLYAGEGSVSDALARARDLLRRLARFDTSLERTRDQVDELYHRATELGRDLGGYASDIDVSPERAEALRRRSDLLFRLKGKYGPTLEDVLTTAHRVADELERLDASDTAIDRLRVDVGAAEKRLASETESLSLARRTAAGRLEEAVRGVLPELGMPGARFEVRLETLDRLGSGGGEDVAFLASLNAGFEVRPLAKIASGGELSRVMLALKSILAREDHVPTLVFDEIDAGIGGTVATAVASKLHEVAAHHQVFVITHLAQLASRGHHHLRVEKGERDGIALTLVELLEGEMRIREIARMLGGDPDSEASQDHAREMLATA